MLPQELAAQEDPYAQQGGKLSDLADQKDVETHTLTEPASLNFSAWLLE